MLDLQPVPSPTAPAGLPDRRLWKHVPDGLAAALACGGSRVPCLVTELSLGCAHVTTLAGRAAVALPLGAEVGLLCDAISFDQRLRGRLTGLTRTGGIVSFRHSPDSELLLSRFLLDRPLDRDLA